MPAPFAAESMPELVTAASPVPVVIALIAGPLAAVTLPVLLTLAPVEPDENRPVRYEMMPPEFVTDAPPLEAIATTPVEPVAVMSPVFVTEAEVVPKDASPG